MTMMTAAVAARKLLSRQGLTRSKSCISSLLFRSKFSTATTTDSFSDRCNLNILSSPYPPIPEGPYPPIAEFVMEKWPQVGGIIERDRVACIDGSTGLSRTFDDYYEATQHIAGSLKEDFDISEESCVALYCPNHVDYLPISLAVSLCGAKLTPINPMYKTDEMVVILDRSHTSVLITHKVGLETALEAAKKSKTVKHVVVVTDDEDEAVPEGTVNLSLLKRCGAPVNQTAHKVHESVDWHPYLLPYSSGTTGLPKGVVLTHKNIVANLLQCDEVEGLAFPIDHKLFSPLPFFHIYGFLVSMLYCAWQGQTVISMSHRFDLDTMCRLVEQHRPERAHLVPPILVGLAKSPSVDKYDLSSLQMIISAAAPLGADTERDVVERIDCDVKQAWGMSELSPIGLINSDFNAKMGSVGPLAPSTYGKVVDEAGNSLPANQDGELLIKGPQVMLGYMDDNEKTRECLSETGWLRTGDVAHYDEDGFFYITDRLKEMIKVRGYQVAPAELEALLLTHEHISDAAVIQIADDASGELPRAYVVRKETDEAMKMTEDDVKEWVKERVAAYKRLDGGVVFIDAVPKSASGKILRRILRDQVAAEQAEAGQS